MPNRTQKMRRALMRVNTRLLLSAVMLLQFAALSLAAFRGETVSVQTLIFAFAVPIATMAVTLLTSKLWPVDRAILILVLFLLSIGVITLSAIAKSESTPRTHAIYVLAGLVAMLFMQFKLGPDMAICLIKSIGFALLSAFVVMPGLLMLFGPLIDRTGHKSFVPKIPFVGAYDYATRHIVPIIFVVVLFFAFRLSNNCPYAYGYSVLTTPKLNETQIAENMIEDNFSSSNMMALVVPKGDYEKEAQLLKELESYDEVDYTMGLANIDALDGYKLADKLTPRQFAELAGLDYEAAQVVYAAYAAENESYGELVGNIATYKVPLIDMFLFLFEKIDQGIVTLDADSQETLDSLRGELERGEAQLRGENWDRMVITADVPIEGDESVALVNALRSLADGRYGEGACLVIGDVTSAKELADTFNGDSLLINLLTIAFVFIILICGCGAPRVRYSGQHLDQLYISVPDTYPRVIRHEYDRLRHSDGGDDRLCHCYHEPVSGSQKAPYAAGGDGAGGQRELSDRYDLRHHHDRCRHSDRIPRVGRIHRPHRSRRWPRRAYIGHPRFERSAAAHRAAR